MRFEWIISLRYLKAKRRQGFISLITVISVTGVTVGVMALIVVLAVMTGFTEGLREKIIGINSHIVIQNAMGPVRVHDELLSAVRETEGVTAITPYIYAQTMLTSGETATGVVLRGIDPDSVTQVLTIGEQIIAGSLADMETADGRPTGLPGILLGKELAGQMRLKVDDKVRLLSPSGPLTPMGVIPKIRTCRVAGIFETGMYEYDSSLAFVTLATAQDFLELGEMVHGFEVNVEDIYQAAQIASELKKKLGFGYVARGWMEMNKNLFSALRLEKTAMFVILALIVLVAAFNIISTLIMVVMEKSKDIAILKSMGATSKSIMRIFIYEGLVIGLTGTILGVSGGLLLCEVLSRYHFIKLPGDVYPMTTLPVEVLPLDVSLVAGAAVLITLLATLYPSWQASRVEPAVALRYE